MSTSIHGAAPSMCAPKAAEPKRKVLSWLPTRGINRRLDYVARVLKAADSSADPRDVLHGCWRFLESLRDGWLATTQDGRLGVVRQVDHTWLRLSACRPGRCDVPLPAMPPPGLGVGQGSLYHHGLRWNLGKVLSSRARGR